MPRSPGPQLGTFSGGAFLDFPAKYTRRLLEGLAHVPVEERSRRISQWSAAVWAMGVAVDTFALQCGRYVEDRLCADMGGISMQAWAVRTGMGEQLVLMYNGAKERYDRKAPLCRRIRKQWGEDVEQHPLVQGAVFQTLNDLARIAENKYTWEEVKDTICSSILLRLKNEFHDSEKLGKRFDAWRDSSLSPTRQDFDRICARDSTSITLKLPGGQKPTAWDFRNSLPGRPLKVAADGLLYDDPLAKQDPRTPSHRRTTQPTSGSSLALQAGLRSNARLSAAQNNVDLSTPKTSGIHNRPLPTPATTPSSSPVKRSGGLLTTGSAVSSRASKRTRLAASESNVPDNVDTTHTQDRPAAPPPADPTSALLAEVQDVASQQHHRLASKSKAKRQAVPALRSRAAVLPPSEKPLVGTEQSASGGQSTLKRRADHFEAMNNQHDGEPPGQMDSLLSGITDADKSDEEVASHSLASPSIDDLETIVDQNQGESSSAHSLEPPLVRYSQESSEPGSAFTSDLPSTRNSHQESRELIEPSRCLPTTQLGHKSGIQDLIFVSGLHDFSRGCETVMKDVTSFSAAQESLHQALESNKASTVVMESFNAVFDTLDALKQSVEGALQTARPMRMGA